MKKLHYFFIILFLVSCSSGDDYIGFWQSNENPNKIVKISKAGTNSYFVFVDNYSDSYNFTSQFKNGCFYNGDKEAFCVTDSVICNFKECFRRLKKKI
jgi:hypothetical protein